MMIVEPSIKPHLIRVFEIAAPFCTDKQLATVFNCTERTVRRYKVKLGITKEKTNATRKEEDPAA